MSYLIGKREIERLRDAVQMREGSNFSEQAFFDKLLAEGSIPPPLLWDLWQLAPSVSQTSTR
jgi:uncharacterized protein (DUF885 family)